MLNESDLVHRQAQTDSQTHVKSMPRADGLSPVHKVIEVIEGICLHAAFSLGDGLNCSDVLPWSEQ